MHHDKLLAGGFCDECNDTFIVCIDDVVGDFGANFFVFSDDESVGLVKEFKELGGGGDVVFFEYVCASALAHIFVFDGVEVGFDDAIHADERGECVAEEDFGGCVDAVPDFGGVFVLERFNKKRVSSDGGFGVGGSDGIAGKRAGK